jgi:hypothetical protein
VDQRLTIMTLADFKKAPRADALLRKMSGSVMKTPADAGAPIPYRISSARVDRDDDTVAVGGWKLADYNGVILFGHDGRQPAIGRSEVSVRGDALMADAYFVSRDLYGFGGMIADMVRAGFMPSASVGFKPTKWEIAADRADEDDVWSAPMNFLEQELLEWSVVTVPSNPDAGVAGSIALGTMIGQAKHAGIDVTPALPWAEEMLARERGQGSWIPRKDLEAITRVLSRATVIDLGRNRDAKSLNGESGGAGGVLAPEGSTMPTKDDDGSEIVTMAAHLKSLGEIKDAMSAMHSEHKSAMADLHQKLAGAQENLDRTHKAMADICSKMSAIVGSDAPAAEPPTAPAPVDDSKAAIPGERKGAGAHALSGEQYKRLKSIRKVANEAIAAHHASDGDEDAEPDADDEKAAPTAVTVVVNTAPAMTEKDADALTEIFSKGRASIEASLDNQIERAKRELAGKPN